MKEVNSEMEKKTYSINELTKAFLFFSLKLNKGTGHDDITYVVSKYFRELCTH